MQTHGAVIHDVVIVGGGPAGLSAALLLARCCKRIAVIDAGRPRNAAASELHGFFTRDGTPPQDMLRLGRDELGRYGVEVTVDSVIGGRCIPCSDDQPFPTAFTLDTEKGRVFTARKLLLATGMCDVLPDLPGVRECYGASVHHCPYCDGYEHRSARLIAFAEVADDAVGLALALRGWSNHVTVMSHGDPITDKHRKRLAGSDIETNDQRIIRLLHEGPKLTGVEMDSKEVIPADGLFFNSGQHPGCDLARSLGCAFDEKAAAKTTDKQKAQVPGLFLAGDVDGDVQFVIVAAAEGATAAVAMNRELQEENHRLAQALAARK